MEDKRERQPTWWTRWGEKERKLALRIAGILVLGLALMYGARFSGNEKTPAPAPQAAVSAATVATEEDLEAKLLRILSAVEGAGKVQVALSFKESAAAYYAQDSELSQSDSEETDDKGGISTSAQHSESSKLTEINAAPVLIKETMPLLNGAVIVAQGAGDPAVKEKLHKAARTLLGLPAHRIQVLKSN